MIWQGKSISTRTETLDALDAISNRYEALAFKEAWLADPPPFPLPELAEYYGWTAEQQLAYRFGDCEYPHGVDLMEWTGVDHPLFGRKGMSIDELFAMGFAIGMEMKEKELRGS